MSIDFGRLRLGESHALGLRLVCSSCSHTRYVAMAAALELWGARSRLLTIGADVRCAQCRQRGMQVTLARDARKFPREPTQHWGRSSEGPLDKLAREITTLKPQGEVH